MHAPKLTHGTQGPLPKPTPRVLNTDEQVPALHRTVIEGALGRVEVAIQEIDAVLRTYHSRDPRVSDLRHLTTRLHMVLLCGDQWLTWHAAAPGGK